MKNHLIVTTLAVVAVAYAWWVLTPVADELQLCERNARLCDLTNAALTEDGRKQVATAILEFETHPELIMDCASERKGYQYAIVVAQKTRQWQGFFDSAETYIKRRAHFLHDTWGVGHKECNNGLLLYLSVEDRYLYWSRGEAFAKSGLLRDDHMNRILERMKPLLRSGKLKEALLVAITDVQDALHNVTSKTFFEDKALPSLGITMMSWIKEAWLSIALVSGVIAVCVAVAVHNQRIHQAAEDAWKRAKKRLEQIETLRQQAQAQGQGATGDLPPLAAQMPCCPICFEDFPTAQNQPAPLVVVLPCKHRFHSGCLDQWFGGQQRHKCPVCQTPAFDADGRLLTQDEVRAAQAGATIPNLPQDGVVGGSAAGGRQEPQVGRWGWVLDAAFDSVSDTIDTIRWATGNGAPPATEATQAEVTFMLRALHQRYPTAVTAETLQTWLSNPRQLHTAPLSTQAGFVQSNPAVAGRASSASAPSSLSGSWWSSIDFGGGISFDGFGGSW